LLKLSTYAALLFSTFLSSGSASYAATNQAAPTDDDLVAVSSLDRLYVSTEWGPLKEVILGRSRFQMGNSLLSGTADEPMGWSSEAMSIFPKDEWSHTFACTKPGNQANWHGQWADPTAVSCGTKSQLYCDSEDNKEDAFCASCYNPCASFEDTEQETNALLEILQNFKHADGSTIKVWRPDSTDPLKMAENYGAQNQELQGTMDIFSRDIVQVIGNVLIMLEPGSPSRRGEQLLYNGLLDSQLAGTNVARVSMPNRDWSKQSTPTYRKSDYTVLEGGDFMLMGDTILIGHSANKVMGSTQLGCEWFRDTIHSLGFTQTVICVPLPKNILHLDIVMSVPRPGLAIVAPAGFSDFAALENGPLKGWDLIKVDELAAMKMAVNGLPLDERNIIVAHNAAYEDPCCENYSCGNDPLNPWDACGQQEEKVCVDTALPPFKFSSKCTIPGQPVKVDGKFADVQGQLEMRGINVYPVMYKNHAGYGGAIRCSTHPFRRDAGSSGM
jgi:N-dimethylarginine dimethylaminohydrolase|tara:strand:- start:610 stop:2106 length:1497 start_codon:yes stop_codon:yes gene_type:complete